MAAGPLVDSLDGVWVALDAKLPRFCGGAVGYAGYDTVRYVERLPNPPLDDRGLPDLCFAFYDRMVIFDHINKTVAAVAHAQVDPNDLRRSYDSACARVDRLVERLQQGVAAPVGQAQAGHPRAGGGGQRVGECVHRQRKPVASVSRPMVICGSRRRSLENPGSRDPSALSVSKYNVVTSYKINVDGPSPT